MQVIGGVQAPACLSCTREHLEAMPADTARQLDPGKGWTHVTYHKTEHHKDGA